MTRIKERYWYRLPCAPMCSLCGKIYELYFASTCLEMQKTFKDTVLASGYLRDNHTDLISLHMHLPKLKGMGFF